jgi:LPS-assembly protein
MIYAVLLPPTRRPGARLLAIAGLTMAFACAALAQDNKQTAPAANPDAIDCSASQARLDWQGEAAIIAGDLSADYTTLRSQRCKGDFVDPLADVDTSENPDQAPIEATADRTEIQGDVVQLSGGVEARQGYRRLRAEEAEFDRTQEWGKLHGDVELREPGLLVRGATGSLNTRTGEASLTAAQFVLHEKHVHGGADLATRRADEILEFDDAYYSYCPPLEEQWVLHAKELEVDLEDGTATARDARIEMGGYPVFYTPYLKFPIDDRRKSGFLWAEAGTDSHGGADIALPYYFNLASNYDATLTPRYIADRGLLTELETRYLSHQLGYWELGGAFISGDDLFQEDYPDDDGDRWLAAVDQHGLFNQRWRTKIDFTNVSDDDYFRDLGTTSLQVQQSTHLAQRGEMDYLGDNWLTQLRLEKFDTIAKDVTTDPYRKVPQLTLLRSTPELDFKPNLLLESDYTYFDHSTDLKGHRVYNSLGVSYPMSSIWGFIKPVAKYRQINYDLDESVFFDQQEDDTPDVGAPLFSLDGGLFFERDLQWGDSTWLQTLEPRTYYLWADHEEQQGLPDFDTSELTFAFNQLYRDTRFSGRDRLDDANQVSVGITTRIIDPATGTEKFTASLGQIYYFDDRLVNVGQPQSTDFEGSSAIAAEFSFAPIQQLDIRTSVLWNTDEDEIDQTYIQMGFVGNDRRIFNLGYSYRRERSTNSDLSDISQVDFSTYFPVNNEWSIFLRTLYDLEDTSRINDMAGIEYNSCCWRVRLVYQRHLDQKAGTNVDSLVDYDRAYFFEFQLKGLGGVGTRVGDMLEEIIRGYTDSEI